MLFYLFINSVIGDNNLLNITNAWTKSPIVINSTPKNNSLIYLNLYNYSDNNYNLIKISSDIVNTMALYQSFIDDLGIVRIVKLDKLVIPPKSNINLEPGGLYIMFLDKNCILKVINKFKLFLYFDNSFIKEVVVKVLY